MIEKPCPDCGYVVELPSSGVHTTDNGCVKVYCQEDQFNSPNAPTLTRVKINYSRILVMKYTHDYLFSVFKFQKIKQKLLIYPHIWKIIFLTLTIFAFSIWRDK